MQGGLQGRYWRRKPESNRRTRICNPLHNHSAIAPVLQEKRKLGIGRCFLFVFGAGDESRTRDLNLGKVALYQLSYSRGGTAFWCVASMLPVLLPAHRHVLKEPVSTKDSDYTQFLGLVRARRCSTGKSRRGIARVAGEQVSLAHGASIAARGSPRLSRSTLAVRSLRMSNGRARDHELPLRRDVAAGIAFEGIAWERCGGGGTVRGLLSGPDCGPGGFGDPGGGVQ